MDGTGYERVEWEVREEDRRDVKLEVGNGAK